MMSSRVSRFKWMAVILIVSSSVACALLEYNRNSTRRWFSSELPSVGTVQNWSESDLDKKLHELSRWDSFSPTQFQSFVEHQIHGLNLKQTDEFRYLEVGVGVGAFARYMLKKYPNATGMGIDIEDSAIQLARVILPVERIHLLVADMVEIPAMGDSFDYVLVPGSLCYLHSLGDVHSALSEFVRVLRPGGGLCASMLPSLTSDMGSCNIRIPKSIWFSYAKVNLGLKVVTMEEMNDWKLPHGMGRYSTCLRKTI